MSHSAVLEPSQPPTRELPAVPRHAAAGTHTPAPDRTDGPSVASFVTALVGLVVPLLCLVAILLGAIGVGRASRRGTRGRGLAKAGITLGVLQLGLTVVVGIVLYLAWDAYGDDLRGGLHGVARVSEQYAGLSATVDRFADGDLGAAWDLARDLGPSGLATLASDAGELRDLASSCRDGDPSACTALLDRLPEGITPPPGG
ncbi:hypothetical protein Xcel_2686 [Xylanimonas cellulosilytica DSM 15894]|uniref:DUF4190 domain-containing protein n=1 Tax=Xylanimonas cellulosilytica (strain DSM 15894 / JCM 12276 / CECT 5975 / KCTC 9989 / LMG 20990 / NBRC 107835 / XIL07) TaxID=446471 RepID=D1BXQ9_XYLCX|nr:DUF4190 domain-containing protein [Xylanimonas cellulosilytica]ACZ31700.1 hypothetical protein Xcel_2686 [Xylanimonas cellulosilytica DSM 15894]